MVAMNEIISKMINSKEYSELAKCFRKNCPKFIKYQEEETAIMKELQEMFKEMGKLEKLEQLEGHGKEKNELVKEKIALMKQMGKLNKKMVKLTSNKDAVYCKMSHCSKEIVALQQKITQEL
jgi:hypothetical protein